ncbi:hypothetical protein IWQ57_004363, partial [Coemansia nantahalensis]
MASETNLFIAVATAIVVLSVALMLVARRFKGVRVAEQERASAEQQQPPRIVLHLRAESQPSKAYNPFSKDELQLLHTVTLADDKVDVLAQ